MSLGINRSLINIAAYENYLTGSTKTSLPRVLFPVANRQVEENKEKLSEHKICLGIALVGVVTMVVVFVALAIFYGTQIAPIASLLPIGAGTVGVTLLGSFAISNLKGAKKYNEMIEKDNQKINAKEVYRLAAKEQEAWLSSMTQIKESLVIDDIEMQ